jgi:ATP-binding cassette subfamily C protein LapB
MFSPESTVSEAPIPDIPPALIATILEKIKLPVAPGSVQNAFQIVQTAEGFSSKRPADRLAAIFKAMQVRKVQVAQLHWDRFDHRQLPVLLLHEASWWLAEKGDDGLIRLSDAQGAVVDKTNEELGNAVLLWLRHQVASDLSSIDALESKAARLIFKEMFQSRLWLLEVLAATLVVNLLAIATSMFSMQVYDRVVPTLAYSTLTALAAGMGLIMLMDWALKHLRSHILDRVAKKVDISVSQQLFEHMMRLRLDSRPRSLGSLAAQVNGLDSVRSFFSSTIVFAVTDMPFALLFIAIIGVIGGNVGWVYGCLLPVSLSIGFYAQKRLRILAQQELQRSNERQGLLVDTLQGAETILSSGSSWRFAETWQAITHAMAGYSLKSRDITATSMTTAATLGQLAYVLAIVVGVYEIEAGALTSGGLIACTILGGRVTSPIAQGVQILVQWENVRESLQMVNRLLDHATDRDESQALLVPDQFSHAMEMEGVTFSYPNVPVKRVNVQKWSASPGERIVILGGLGSGKSTLLRLLAGLYKPSEGQIRIGGADMWQMAPEILQDKLAYLPQDVSLFKGTLRSNLTLAGGSSDARLMEVMQDLGVDRIAADNPRSFEMEIQEGGQGLSGGQRQLVGLSRVFLAAPRVWLLDEPTVSLDSDSENRVLAAFNKYMRSDDILIATTHRPQVLSLATRVIIMHRGQIAADGKPEDILRPNQPAKTDPSNQTVSQLA